MTANQRHGGGFHRRFAAISRTLLSTRWYYSKEAMFMSATC